MKKILPAVLVIMMTLHVSAQITLPYSQDFEAATFPPAGWQTFPIGSAVNWIRDTNISGYGIGTACTSFDNYNTTSGYYGIRLPSMNFTNASQPYIRFDIAYAQRTAATSDVFGLWWSNNGTSNWQNLQNYSGTTLATAPYTSNLFVPSANQWQTITLSLASLAGLPFVRLAIEDDCLHGNMIYFDNVFVFDTATTSMYESSGNQFLVYPNPVGDKLTVQYNSANAQTMFTLYNSMGVKILSEPLVNKKNVMDLSGYTDHIYFYTLTSGKNTVETGKLIKH